MNEVSFVEKRSVDWKLLNQLTDKAEYNLKHLSAAELRELVRTYRRVSSDLALVRTKSDNTDLIVFLNDLVARAYSVLYAAPRKPLFVVLAKAISRTAYSVRKLRWFVATSVAIFAVGGATGFFSLKVNPDTRAVLVPPQFEKSFEAWKSGKHQERSGLESAMMTGFYSANNPLVALVTGAMSAATFGISTTISIYNNGLVLGALLYEVGTVGKSGHLIVSITPHGVTEISGIILSGAAGLSLGWALIFPGRRKRGQALALAGKDALVVLVASIIMMYMAAPIEGFFSFNPNVPNEVKAAFALLSALAWGFFWVGYGKRDEWQFEPERTDI